MDNHIDQAVREHLEWRIRLQDGVNQARQQLALGAEVTDADTDAACALEVWLHSLRPEYGHNFAFLRLQAAHSHFHTMAFELTQAIRVGDEAFALASMRNGDYALASDKLIDALLRFRDEARRAREASDAA